MFPWATTSTVSIIGKPRVSLYLCKLRKWHKGQSNSFCARCHKFRAREAVGTDFFVQQTARIRSARPLLPRSSLSASARWQFYSCAPHTQYTNTSEINVCFHRLAVLSWYLFQRRQSPTLLNSPVREQLYNSSSSPQGDPQIHYQKLNESTFSTEAEGWNSHPRQKDLPCVKVKFHTLYFCVLMNSRNEELLQSFYIKTTKDWKVLLTWQYFF